MTKLTTISLASISMMAVAFFALSVSVFDIEYPIAELENCANRQECKEYCDNLAHKDVCLVFARTYNLVDAKTAEKASKLPDIGPGGCKGEQECRTYCDDALHYEECLSFAEEHNIMSKQDIQRAKKDLLEKGPGGCRGINECHSYCEEKEHRLECLDYAHKKGQISDSSYQTIKQVEEQSGPGGCKGENECRSYCEDSSHLDECLTFAEKQGFVSSDEAQTLRKTGIAGAGPGGCHGKEQCRNYCENPDHQKECIDFAEEKGFMSKEEVARARKFIGKTGPGGCQGEACKIYCDDPGRTEECLDYAEQEGFLPKEEVARVRKFLKASAQGGPGGCKGRACEQYCQDPSHKDECFAFAKKQGLIKPEEEKEFEAGQNIRKKVEQSGGPGGCKSDDECRIYCSDGTHTEECIAFAAAHGGVSEQQAREMLQQFTSQKFEANGGALDDFRKHNEDASVRFQEFKMLEQQFRGHEFTNQGFGLPGPKGIQGSGGRNPQFGFPSGQFPGQRPGQNEYEGPQGGLIGPGGCTSPQECITYCTEHRDECFSQGSPSEQGQRGFYPEDRSSGNRADEQSRFGQPPFMPQLRGDIMHEFKSEDLPEGFERRSMEERQQFFQQKFQEFRGEPGVFPGMPSQGFPENFDQNFKRPEFNKDSGQQDDISNKFRGIAPGEGTRGIFDSLEGKQQQNSSGEFHPMFSDREGQQPQMQGDQYQPHIDGQSMPSSGIPGQQMPPGGFYPKQDEEHSTQQGEQFPMSPQLNPYQQFPTGGGSFPLPPGGSTGVYQPPTGTGGTYVPPTNGTGDMGGSMPPPPNGTTGESQFPPDMGGSQMPPLPSSFAPSRGFFANIIRLFFSRQ